MDTTKLIDAIAQADKADFDAAMLEAKKKSEVLASVFLELSTLDILMRHSSRATTPALPLSVLYKAQDMLDQLQYEITSRYPEVKDLL
jgi:hypothetical protein